MKLCVKCQCELDSNKKKFCSDSCKYWYNLVKKEKEAGLPPAKKRNKNFFYMVTGSEVYKSGSRQGKRTNGTIMGSMAARVLMRTEECVELNKQNLERHFKGITGYIPNGIMLGDRTYIKKEDIFTELGILI